MLDASGGISRIESWDRNGIRNHSRSTLLVENSIIRRNGVRLHPKNVVIDTSPNKALSFVRHGDAVEVTTINARYVSIVLEAFNDSGFDNGSIIFAGIIRDTGLPIIVGAPGVDVSILMYREGMVGAGSKVDNSFRQSKLSRYEGAVLVAVNEAAAKFMLVTTAPGENRTLGGEGEGVIRAGGDLGDLLQAGDKNRSGLNAGIG